MTKEAFQKLLKEYEVNFRQVIGWMKKKEITKNVSIDYQIAWYCLRQLDLVYNTVPDHLEISCHMARCYMEVEMLLKWLKLDKENYNAFIADAEFAQLDLAKSKKEAISLNSPEFEKKFEDLVLEIQRDIEEKGHRQYHDKRAALYRPKDAAMKIDKKSGVLFGAKFNFFSKMSHPTAWLIMMDPNSGEDVVVRREAMNAIKNSVIIILNIFAENYNCDAKKTE